MHDTFNKKKRSTINCCRATGSQRPHSLLPHALLQRGREAWPRSLACSVPPFCRRYVEKKSELASHSRSPWYEDRRYGAATDTFKGGPRETPREKRSSLLPQHKTGEQRHDNDRQTRLTIFETQNSCDGSRESLIQYLKHTLPEIRLGQTPRHHFALLANL